MNQKQLTTTVDDATKSVCITGLRKEIAVSYLADVEFTDLIAVLSETLEENVKINFTMPKVAEEDGKLKLVLEAIQEIIGKYNDTFEDPTPPTTTITSDTDDLPF